MRFLRKKTRNKELEGQIVKMYGDIMKDRYSTNQEMFNATQNDDELMVTACGSRLSCLHQYALQLENIMKKNDIDFLGR